MNKLIKRSGLAVAIAGICLSTGLSQASSHREAPFITEMPKVDGTDFYMFRSYEAGRENYVTLIANYLPLQDAYGGPNYFDLDEDAIYEIHIDNTGNAEEDLTFRFDFTDVLADLKLPVGESGDIRQVSIPLKNKGDATNPENVNFSQTYTVSVIRGDRRSGADTAINVATGQETFAKPLDNIGEKSFGGPDGYKTYADQHVFDIAIPGCSVNGRVFAGQRQEAFAVNLGKVFDLVNFDPIADMEGERNDPTETNDLADKNVTSLALEVPTVCLTGTAENADGQPIIGGWTTASVRQARVINPAPSANGKGATVEGGAYTQVSRLGMPLVNEVVIGLKDKDRFNASEPKGDAQFATYVTHPTLPELLEILFSSAGAEAPNTFPRSDLVAAFLTGVPANSPVGVEPSEMLRLNPVVAPTPLDSQNDLGFVAGDQAGFPNGRRPYDDVVDVALRVVMGALTNDAPNRDVPFTDRVQLAADPTTLSNEYESFPYLITPLPGSVN